MSDRPDKRTGSEHRIKEAKNINGKGTVVIVSGPSAVGKSTICKEVVKRLNYVQISVSVTTRAKAQGEVDGVDYRFISKQQFDEQIKKGLLLEYADVFGHMYGTPKSNVDQALRAGKTIILEIDVQGAKLAKAIYPEAVMIFILPPSHADLAKRLNNRNRDDDEAAEKRLDAAGTEIAAAWQYYKYMVINEDLKHAVNEMVQIIEQNVGEKKQ